MNPITKTFNFPEEILSKYDIIQEMGRGAFSIVYKIKSKTDNTFYCLKKINIKKTPDRKNEINILSKLNHPNLVKYISSYEDEEGIYIIMEFCIYGDLYSLLHMVKKKKVYVNEEIIWEIAYQSLLGLEYLHSHQIIHRDIKLLNIFMSTNKVVKIGDMGMSKILSKKEMKLSRVGTPLFLAPELVMKEKYDFKADIWSLGCSIYHLAKTSPPFNDENLIKLGKSIVNENPPELPGCYSDEFKFFVNKLMTKNKKMRPNATEAMQFIPDKIKIKFEKKNDANSNMIIIEEAKKRIKDDSNIKNNTNNIISNNGNYTNVINNLKNSSANKYFFNNQNKLIIPKSPTKETSKELISGQTFYRYFRKNSEQSQRKLKTSLLGLKKGKISSSLFDSKNMNSLLIMSKTMGGTREGFFRHKNIIINQVLPIEEEVKTKLEQKRSEEQKGIDNNIPNKSLTIETDKKKENNKNDLNIVKDNQTENINKNVEPYSKKENDVWKKTFNYSNRDFKDKDEKKFYNFFNKKNKIKTKTEINFFNPNNFGLYKSYQKNKQPEQNNNIKFPLIQQGKTSKILKHFNNNIYIHNKIEKSFRKTADSFNCNNKLTIHDLK